MAPKQYVVGGAPGFDITAPAMDYEKGPFKLVDQKSGDTKGSFKTLEEAVQAAVREAGERPRRARVSTRRKQK